MANLDDAVTQVKAVLNATVGIAVGSIEVGRRSSANRTGTWAVVRKPDRARRRLVGGAKLIDWVIEVRIYFDQHDEQRGEDQKAEMETLQQALIDAFEAKTRSDFPTLTAVTTIDAVAVSVDEKDDDDSYSSQIRSVTRITFPFWETI